MQAVFVNFTIAAGYATTTLNPFGHGFRGLSQIRSSFGFNGTVNSLRMDVGFGREPE